MERMIWKGMVIPVVLDCYWPWGQRHEWEGIMVTTKNIVRIRNDTITVMYADQVPSHCMSYGILDSGTNQKENKTGEMEWEICDALCSMF